MQTPAADPVALAQQMQQLNTLLGQLVQTGSHLMTGGMSAHVLEWLKGKPGVAPIWNALSSRAKVIWGALVAALPAAGIVFTFKHAPDGDFILNIHDLNWVTFGIFAWSFLQNWFAQQGYYQTVLKPRPVSGPPAPTGTGAGVAPPVQVVVEGVKP
jgi:hypothetical protein